METVLFSRKFLTTSHPVTVSFYIWSHEENYLNVNAPYQRDYVWGEKEQQDFLFSLFNNLPLGIICLVTDLDKDAGCYEVVDGKQRITTLIKFLNNEIPYKYKGVDHYHKDMTALDKRVMKNRQLPYEELYHEVSESDKLEYFYRINFTGVPQSDEHRKRIEELIRNN